MGAITHLPSDLISTAAKAIRHELDEVEALTEYSERGAAEICESAAAAALAAAFFAPSFSINDHRWNKADRLLDKATMMSNQQRHPRR
jgi:hypothetical protein